MSFYLKLLQATGGNKWLRSNIQCFFSFSTTTTLSNGSSSSYISNSDCKCSTSVNNENKFLGNRQIFPFEKMPTATRFPFIGTKLNFLFAGSGKMLHKYIDIRHRQLGPIFREPLGPVDGVFISSPDLIRQIFLHEGKYPKHPLPDAWILYNELHNCKRGLFFMQNDEWLTNRKIMNTIMLRNDIPLAQEATRTRSIELINKWQDNIMRNDHHNNDLYEIPHLINSLYRWSINVIIDIMLGSRVIQLDPILQRLLDEFSQNVHKMFEHSAPLMSISPKLARMLHMPIWTKFEMTVKQILSLSNSIIDRALINENLKLDNGLILEMMEHGMSTDVIKRIFVDLLIAAGDTTAFSTQWALFLLAKNDRVQNEVRNDIKIHENSMECPLIRGTVREALRLFPVATFIGRILETETTIGNYKIPKYTPTLASMYTSGRDEHNFPEPLKFLPSRWNRDSNGSLQCVHHPTASLPYAMGSRSCVGQKIANMQMHIFLTEILKHFELKLLNKNDVNIVIKMIAVPSEQIRIGLKKIN